MGLLVLVLLIAVVSVGIGAVQISPVQTISILLSKIGVETGAAFTPLQENVLMQIRLPRVVLGLLIGAALGVAGTAIQGLFRNPLADPALIGISSGAAFFAAMMIVFSGSVLHFVDVLLGHWSLPAAAFLGGFLTTLVIYRLATHNGVTSVPTMLLAGIAINALATAGVGILIFTANDAQLRDIAFWNLGSLGLADWNTVATIIPFVIITVVPLVLMARALNALLLGELEAEHLGYNTERIKQGIVVLVALAVGAGVAVSGIIGFVGLIVPHLIRLIIGPDHRYVLPGSLLLGAALLTAADLLARTVASPAEVPIGIVTALVGAPFFLYLLVRDRTTGRLV
jgi:iron complex transport system permease protein